MTKSKLTRWLMRGAFTLAAVVAVSVLSAEQANAQFYGSSRGISVGSFGRGVTVSFGNFNRGYGYGGRSYSGYGGGVYRGGYSRGYSSYRPSYGGYRGGSFYGGGGYRGGYSRGRY